MCVCAVRILSAAARERHQATPSAPMSGEVTRVSPLVSLLQRKFLSQPPLGFWLPLPPSPADPPKCVLRPQ